MKKANIIAIAAAVAFAVFGGKAEAADTTTANASATLVSAITLTKVTDLDFGRLSSGTGGGTATVSAADARSVSGDVVEEGGTPAAANFDITGEDGLTYDITLPASVSITSGGNSMTVDTFTSDKSLNVGTLTSGADSFKVGATLTVGANQPIGVYTGTFDVTCTYQ